MIFRTVHNEKKEQKKIRCRSQCLMYVKVHQGTFLAPVDRS